MIRLQPPSIEEAVAYLYEESETPPPTLRRCIPPLRKLVTGCSLLRVELPDLTRQAAIQYLSQSAPTVETFTDEDRVPLSGFLYASPKSGTIFIKRLEPVTRRRFTMAHEIGHYLLHLSPLFDYLVARGKESLIEIADYTPAESSEMDEDIEGSTERATLLAEDESFRLLPPLETMEREADRFATELLMPAELVRELAERHADDLRNTDLVWRLASEMLVSTSAMSRRLSDLGLIAAAETVYH